MQPTASAAMAHNSSDIKSICNDYNVVSTESSSGGGAAEEGAAGDANVIPFQSPQSLINAAEHALARSIVCPPVSIRSSNRGER